MCIVRQLASRSSGWQSREQGEFRTLTALQINHADPMHLWWTIQPSCHTPVTYCGGSSCSWQQCWLPFGKLWYIGETSVLGFQWAWFKFTLCQATCCITWGKSFWCPGLKFSGLWKERTSKGFCARSFKVCSGILYVPQAASHGMCELQHQQTRHSPCFTWLQMETVHGRAASKTSRPWPCLPLLFWALVC